MKKRPSAPLELIPAALEKTGFILENAVATEFKNAGWATIGGRYYADDVDGQARELDLVAYRAQSSADVDVMTAVLVSCKKDEETTWSFMTKKRPAADPNNDWDPVHVWTDVQPLQTFLATDKGWKDRYIEALGADYENEMAAARDTFAFQQVSTAQKPAARNDRAIFNSIVTLMKALDHEKESLSSRMKGKKRLYLFSLVSVVDAAMVEVDYASATPTAREIERLTHLARYMVRKRDVAALIHFVRADTLPTFIGHLTRHADESAKHMVGLVNEAYGAIRTSQSMRAYFCQKLETRLLWAIKKSFQRSAMSVSEDMSITLSYVDDSLVVNILPADQADIDALNRDSKLNGEAEQILLDVARYKGKFKFDWDIPF